MNKKDLDQVEDRIVRLLRSRGGKRLDLLATDCCSEMARLVGRWIQELQKPDKLLVIKGIGLRNGNFSHEVLAIFEGAKISIIDPTVWQFFPDKNIFVGEFTSLEEVCSGLAEIYGGEWKMNEELKNISSAQKKEWEEIINKNIR